jgi:hypothetical protein
MITRLFIAFLLFCFKEDVEPVQQIVAIHEEAAQQQYFQEDIPYVPVGAFGAFGAVMPEQLQEEPPHIGAQQPQEEQHVIHEEPIKFIEVSVKN